MLYNDLQYKCFGQQPDGIKYSNIDEESDTGREYLEAIRAESQDTLGYFLKPYSLDVSEKTVDRFMERIVRLYEARAAPQKSEAAWRVFGKVEQVDGIQFGAAA